MTHTPDDPMRAAQTNMRPELPKRFYRDVTVIAVEGGHAIALDGRTARTPARAPLVVARAMVAEGLAAEWRAVADRIDPALMPLTRLACSAIDGVAHARAPVAAEIARYAGTDLVCYRADRPTELARRQALAWDPVLAWAGTRLGVRLAVTTGIGHVGQPDGLATAVLAALPGEPLALAAVHTVTTLTGSALLALALAEGHLDVPSVWAAAHVDEDWNIELWGQDAEAAARRAFRFSDMDAAGLVLEASRPSSE